VRTLRALALPTLAVVLVATLGACSGDDGESAPKRTSTSTTTTSSTPAPPVARFTITGARSGFAHGYELVRRESPADVEADLDLMADTGAEWLRVGISWGQVEPAPGAAQWAGIDRVVQGALRRGMSVVAAVSSAPHWAAAPGCHTNECAPRDPAQYAAFMRTVVARYAPLGVHHWEIWNEPNHVPFWGPRPDPVAYTEVLKQASTAIHQVDRDAVVMSGGLSPAPDAGGEISPLQFLRRVYELGGGPYIDAVANHPYQYPDRPTAPSPSNAFLQTQAMHDLMVEFGDGAKQIWGTEVGAPTRGPRSVSEANQAVWLRELYDVWNGWAFTGPLLWYAARDTGTRSTVDDSYGLVRQDRTPKPALAAFDAMVQSSSRPPTPLRRRR
jgi:hypothetical protein